ncbi:archaellum component FlaC [Virgibacillus halotolerans]|uniref:hypothetical protein n=1 Tax=Virgibacillus halotolerans TaxID=1071053 RepID=UPI0019615C93|nr:hypothetical protein [Virgibacillus halotolerans]MBM7598175.1 archaellum component FlaC [Virgibacillus halotolerans]
MEDIFDDIEKSFTLFRDVIKQFPDRHGHNIQEVSRLDREQQDLLHLIEFIPMNAYQGWNTTQRIKHVRRDRRKVKEETELLEPIIPLLKKYRQQLTEMDKVIGEIRKVKKRQENRQYTCKGDKSLQENFDKGKLVTI